MRASECIPMACIVNIGDIEYVRIGGEDWSPNLIARDIFDERFVNIAGESDFFAALENHPATQTPGWQAGIKWMKAQV